MFNTNGASDFKSRINLRKYVQEIDAISMILKSLFDNHHHLHGSNVLSVLMLVVQGVSDTL